MTFDDPREACGGEVYSETFVMSKVSSDDV